MESMVINGYGKINLGLDVIRKREDGYHDVKMIMQTVDLFDTITITKQEKEQITIRTNKAEIPCDENNLIYKAVNAINEYSKTCNFVDIHLEKRIPIAAGMAGGSTDAAATLKGMNELFQLGLSMEELEKLAVGIGADVPYCLTGKTALSEGIGEILTSLKMPPECVVLLAKPDINVSTKYVYENLHANTLTSHPDIDGMIVAIEQGDLEGLTNRLGNVLETVTVNKYPIIKQIKETMIACNALNALMSGSGPTVFGIFTKEEYAKEAKAQIEEANLAKEVYVTRFV